jgi:hypothetical protein
VAGAGTEGALIDAEPRGKPESGREEVAGLLRDNGVDAVVIGAVALAAHRYVRYTEDIDLGVNADLPTLRTTVAHLREAGFTAELREPDADDPPGGVIDVTGAFGAVRIISCAGRFPAVIQDAIKEATQVIRPGSPLLLVPIAQLVALKLYAGGLKSKADIVELLSRNPDADRDGIRRICDRYRLGGLEELIAEAL